MQPLPLLLWGFALGFQAAAPIGPVNLAIISRGLRLGGAAAFFLGCGAVTADCAYFGLAILATRAAGSTLANPWVRPVVFLAGGAYLAWLGLGAMLLAPADSSGSDGGSDSDTGTVEPAAGGGGGDRGGEARTPAPAERSSAWLGWLMGVGMTLMNPMTIAYWLSVAGTLAADPRAGSPWFGLAGVAAGALSWVIGLSTFLAIARRRIPPRAMRTINVLSGIGLLGFGASFAWRGLRAALAG